MRQGEFSGEGNFVFGSLDKYQGDFIDGKLEGSGKMTYRDGHIYVGRFQDWKKKGDGKMTFRNGDIVEGVWDGPEGKGTITYTDGSMYQVAKKTVKHGREIRLFQGEFKRTRSMVRDLTHIQMGINIQECTR